MKFKSITLSGFKGQTDPLTLDFKDGVNVIAGANGTGKTTALDAIAWCLFSKNSEDKEKFGVLNVYNASLVPCVELTIEVDDETYVIKKWLTNKTNITVDGVEKPPTQFAEWIKSIGIEPTRFKIFSNPTYFCEMQWEKARAAFMNCFTMPEAEIVYKAMGEFSEQFKADMQKFKGKVEDCQIKYDTALKAIEKQKIETGGKLKAVDEQLAELAGKDPKKLKAERDALQKEIADAEKLEKLYDERVTAYRQKQKTLSALYDKMQDATRNEDMAHGEKERALQRLIDGCNADLAILRDEYTKLALRRPRDVCALCGQNIPSDKLAAANAAYEKTLIENKAKGTAKKEELEKYEKQRKGLTFKYSKETQVLKAEYEKARDEFSATPNPADEKPTDISAQRNRLSELDKLLARADLLTSMKDKKAQYEAELKRFAAELTDTETLVQTAKAFVNKRAELVVKAINKKLGNGVQIQLFEQQKNGSLKDTFVITKDNVLYGDANSTGKVEVGLTITGFIKKALGIKTPVIIDNFERYPNLVLPIDDGNQYILAMADKNCKTIEVR